MLKPIPKALPGRIYRLVMNSINGTFFHKGLITYLIRCIRHPRTTLQSTRDEVFATINKQLTGARLTPISHKNFREQITNPARPSIPLIGSDTHSIVTKLYGEMILIVKVFAVGSITKPLLKGSVSVIVAVSPAALGLTFIVQVCVS